MLSLKSQLEIAKECGLTFQRMEDNAPQFLGTDKQFEAYYEELKEAEQGAIDGQDAEDGALRDARFF